ncbi:uncharacterized protein [Rutidosis leptorrhynchoides]|uniref:uncharacterized protein n=1 Tax=Rutidosis leptorrhynchoides TaxID=125765 RepID=UPI003A99FC01
MVCLRSFLEEHEGECVLFGDWNVVCEASERFGCVYNQEASSVFNSFIHDLGLVELPLEGRRFTWVNKTASKMSHLDHILTTNDYGPLLSKFFNSWLLNEEFDGVVRQGWSKDEELFFDKLKALKLKINTWAIERRRVANENKNLITGKIKEIDDKIDEMVVDENDLLERKDLCAQLDYIKKLEDMDMIQKSRIKWDVEGDENSKFFQALLKQKGQSMQSMSKFERDGNLVSPPTLSPTVTFSELENTWLEHSILEEEIREAVWDCGSSKASGPNDFSFSFIKDY